MSDVVIDHTACAALFLNRGISRLRRNHFADAISDFDKTIQFSPDNLCAHWNKATALLSMGDYQNGFQEHDWGWQLFCWKKFDATRLHPLPVWDGCYGKRLLLYHELGHGDALMAFRFLPLLKQQCASVTLLIDPALERLARRYDIAVATAIPHDFSAFDCRLPLFGVMRATGATTSNIPRQPYIEANWRRTGGKLGLCWSGQTQQMFTGSMFLSMLRGCDHYMLHSLQPGEPPSGVRPLQSKDFADTASVVEQMDHIVTVDTALAHLAGAMGHPSIHVVLPFMSDWRWWQTEVWYPQIKTYRQPQPGYDWSEPFARISEAIFSQKQPAQDGERGDHVGANHPF